MSSVAAPCSAARWHARAGNASFFLTLGVISGTYVLLILLLIGADVLYLFTGGTADPEAAGGVRVWRAFESALRSPEIRNAIQLTLVSCTITAVLSVLVAIPVGYLLARYRFPGCGLIDAVLDIPIVLPPLVVGLSLLILFQFLPRAVREAVVYERPGVVLAQFMVACAFAVRTMRASFDQIDTRCEQVALTLGCTRAQAFLAVVLPEARPGVLTAATLAWARALGEFGPLLVFAGATRNKTEVLSTTVFLELSIGDLTAAVTVSLIMVVAAVIVVITARTWGTRDLSL
jgi:molybdate transport system permease protein